MKCPNCRCEIGSQPVCPYCGRVIYQTAQRGWGEYAPQLRALGSAVDRVQRSVSAVELRSQLTVILLGGIFVMQILIALICVLK